MRPLVVAWLALFAAAACSAPGPRLDLTLTVDGSVDDAALARIVALDFHASGAAAGDSTLTLSRPLARTEALEYRAATGALTLRVDALDAAHTVVASGTTPALALTAHETVALSVTLDAASTATGYPAVVLADAPLAYYRLDETSGSVASDSSGNGHDGAYGAAVTHTAGLVGSDPTDGAAAFPGGAWSADGIITVPRSALLEPTQAISIEVWVTAADDSNVYDPILSYGTDAMPTYESYLLQIQNGLTQFFVALDGTAPEQLVQPTLQPGQTYHVVGTYDSVQQLLVLYVNGVATSMTVQSGPIVGYTTQFGLAIGSSNTSQDGGHGIFHGTIDDVAIYGTALSAARVMAHYTAGLAPAQ